MTLSLSLFLFSCTKLLQTLVTSASGDLLLQEMASAQEVAVGALLKCNAEKLSVVYKMFCCALTLPGAALLSAGVG